MDKKYLVKITFDGETFPVIMTGRKLAERYEASCLCGIGEDFEVYDIDSEPVKVKLLSVVDPILDQLHWMQQEYNDYCEEQRYN